MMGEKQITCKSETGMTRKKFINLYGQDWTPDTVILKTAELQALNNRIKELEQERGTFHQFRAEAVIMRKMLLGKDVDAKDVAPCDLEEALLKRDLEQQAIILENMISEIGVAPMVPIDDPHCCAVAHNDVLSYMDAEAKQLRKQAEDL